MPYFSRGIHAAALVGVAVLTSWILAVPAFLYYFLRHDRLVCPRCGYGCGAQGERASPVPCALPSPEMPGMPSAGRERRWRLLGWMLLVAAAVIGVMAVTEGAFEAFVVAAGTGAGGALALRSAQRARIARRAAILGRLQLPVLQLAADSGGQLTVSETASSLGWTLARAEKVLHSLDDGFRVSSEVTRDGVIVYEFRELLPGRDERFL